MAAERTVRILVVDDDEVVRGLLARALREEGYEVAAVGPGPEGTSAAQAAAPFHLVITNQHRDPWHSATWTNPEWACYSGVAVLHLDELALRDLTDIPLDRPSLYQPFSIKALLLRVRQLVRPHPAGGREPA
jgi:two-component system, cell cycle sensor histidine kinase and response regulator CckA